MLLRDPRKHLTCSWRCVGICDVKFIYIFYTLFHQRSAFFVFCADFRPKVKEETPGLSIGDVAKKLGERWNKISAEEKQPYEKKAAKLKEKYEKVRKDAMTN